MSDFSGKRFAVPRGTALVGFIHQNYPEIELVETENLQRAFSLLAAGQVEAVGSYASAGYLYTVQEGIQNVSIVGSVGFDYHISFGSRVDEPVLNQLMTKALEQMEPEQKYAIEQRWVQPEDSQRVALATVKEVALYLVLALVSIGLLVVGFWNRSLKREIGFRHKAQDEIRFLAYHDELTGVYNRQFFLDTLAEFTRLPVTKDSTTCVLLLGLDSFRALNDSLGHKFGDYILGRVAERLNNRFNRDSIIARVGGDEFAIILRDANNHASLSHLAEKLIFEISRPIIHGDQSIAVGATVGIACQEEDDVEPVTMLECADLALHQGKRINSGGFMFYSESMSRQMHERKLLAQALRTAIGTAQLYLVYQPQVRMDTEEVIGFEALARWNHPEKGAIPPDEFIPLAEDEGMIVTLGDRVLYMACKQGRTWLDDGVEFSRIAVNVSVKQFVEQDFPSKVLNVLSQTDFPANKLELEITESVFVGDMQAAKETMQRLTQQGVNFAIDDFGTGFSSLLYLKELPVSKIKLDQGFIREIVRDYSSLQIVKASVQMGRALNMQVIAEGGETELECSILKQLNCDQAQGHFYSRPVAADQLNAVFLSQISKRSVAIEYSI